MLEGWLLHGLLIAAAVGVSLYAAGHALLNKRDPHAALGWVFVCVAYPVLGALAYAALGVNRIRTRGRELGARWERAAAPDHGAVSVAEVRKRLGEGAAEIAAVSEAVTRRPLLDGNRVTPLFHGEEAFPAMLAAIEDAQTSVWLATYLFETDVTGRAFIDALTRSAARGVDVRVLLDGVGDLYTAPRASTLLRRRGVRVARFLPLALDNVHFNLRNHRKILVVDHRVGFTGGMNIGDRHLVQRPGARMRVQDVHFRVEGPVVEQLEGSFLEDWCFTTDDRLPDVPLAFPDPAGDAMCRGITDGPNEDFEQLIWILLGAVNGARESVRIMNPYFLPYRELVGALNAAALRGVAVDVVLPSDNNLRVVHWASCTQLPLLLRKGVRVSFQAPPFAHTKLVLIDDCYALVGSANLDPRSLRLNFELQLEIFDRGCLDALRRHFDEALAGARPITEQALAARPLWMRLRDSTAKLFTPYL